MKLFKKVSAMMVSLLMALAMMVPVAAADATVTIKNKGDNEELKYIQVIVPDRTTKTGWKFADTTIAEEFTKVFGKSEQEILKEMTTDNAVASKVRTALKGVQVAKANDLVTINGNSFTASTAGAYAIFGTDKANKVTYSPMLAYVGVNYENGKQTSLKNTSVTVKKEETTVTKDVKDEDQIVEIGRDVEYTVTSVIPYVKDGETNPTYQVIDEITGATYKVDNNGELSVNVSYGENSEVIKVTPANGSFTLDLSKLINTKNEGDKAKPGLKDEYLNENAGLTLTLTYTATVTDVTVGNTVHFGNGTNEGKDKYGHDSVTIKSAEVEISKYAEDGETPLENAGFVFYREEKGTKKYALFDENNVFKGYGSLEEAKANPIMTDANGKAVVKGLDSEYTFIAKEVVAPEGYSVADDDENMVQWTTEENGEVSFTDTKVGSLPETGGIGTTIFTVGGCAIMVVAAALFFMNKKKHEK